MDKKKGSAMVLAILLLAFFMALSLNMWFISQKKAQRAGDKIVGNSVLTDIDGSSTLGYYEFYLATEYMTKGFVTFISTGTYTVPTSTTTYAVGGVPISTTIEGIWLENEKQYFASYLKNRGTLSTSANAILNTDSISGGALTRDWEVTGGAIVEELWEAGDWASQESFGGYKIKSVTVGAIGGIYDKATFIGQLTAKREVLSEYEKIITLGATPLKNQTANYKIIVKRTSEISLSGTSIEIESDQINEIIVTKQ